MSLIDVSLNESDRRLLIVLLIILVLLLVIIGLVGMLIRHVTNVLSKRMDNEIHDVVVYRVVGDPKSLKKYGNIKNNRLFFRQALVPFLIALVSLLIYIIYSATTNSWTEDYFGAFSTLLFKWDWSNPDNYGVFWGMTLLTKWPDLIATPSWHWDYWASYLLVPLWLTSIIYYAIVVQAYIARLSLLHKRCRSVYEKNLDGFKFYDNDPLKRGTAVPPASTPTNTNDNTGISSILKPPHQ